MPGYYQAGDLGSRNYTGTPQGYSPWVDAPFFPSYATIDEVTNAYKKVLSDVGCNLPQIDDHDARVIRETIDGTYTYSGSVSGLPGLPDTTDDVGGWEDYGNETRPANFDTDHDGMPNWWELIKGLNTNSTAGDFSESNSDLAGDGYTALEDYLNWLAEPHTDCSAGATVDIDLNALSRGYTNTTYAYSFSGAVNGSVALVSNRFARFSPNTSANALASFSYTVTNTGKSYNMTRLINVRVVGSSAAPTNAPATPTGLNATAGDAQVTLNWEAAAEATSYIVKRSTVNGGPYTSIATNATPSYVNTGLVNGTTYYYVVVARNVIGDSGESSQASATPQLALPTVPTGLSATAGNGQVALSWSAASGATGYIVKRSTRSGSGYVNIVTNATTTYTNTGLANGTPYYFVVSAVNAAGESGNSSQASATPGSSGSIVVVDGPSAVVTGSSATTVTTPVTVTPGANALVVLINNMKEASAGAWTVTWNGQTLANAVVLQSGSTGAKSCIYYLYNPVTDGAAHNLAVTFTTGATGYHIQYFTLAGVNTAVAPLTGSANASSTIETFTIAGCPLNGLAALNAVNSSSSGTTTAITAYGSGTLTAQNITGSSPSCSIGYANNIAAGSDTFTATASVSGKFAFTAAVFTPAPALDNNAPVLPAISNRVINVGANLFITNNATDADAGQTLTYTLLVKPTGATINSNVASWRPTVSQANTTNAFSVVVADNGSPSLSATQNFSVVVNPLTPPTVAVPVLNAGQIGLSVSGQVGPDYAVQGSSNLVNWDTLLITNPVTMPFSWSTNIGTLPAQYYRIKVGPPLP